MRTDVMIKMSANRTAAALERTIRHEMGHVVTLGSRSATGDGYLLDDGGGGWLKEGIAEYIAFFPRPATSSPRTAAVRRLVRGSHAPRSIVTPDPGATDPDAVVDGFYGYSHFAVSCPAAKYGEATMLKFAAGMQRGQLDEDEAARRAFGTTFDQVDAGCVTWIRQHV